MNVWALGKQGNKQMQASLGLGLGLEPQQITSVLTQICKGVVKPLIF